MSGRYLDTKNHEKALKNFIQRELLRDSYPLEGAG